MSRIVCLARWYRARRSVVRPQDDAANSVITICVAYMSLTKNTILVRSRLCMYITGDRRTVVARRGFVALIVHRYYLRPVPAADFHPPYRDELCTLRGTNVELGRRKSDSAVCLARKHSAIIARIQVAKFQSAKSRDFSRFVDLAVAVAVASKGGAKRSESPLEK